MVCINMSAPGVTATALARPHNPWILGRAWKDFSMLLLPAIIGFVASRAISYDASDYSGVFVLFLVYGWLDSGHVWSTLWRSHWHAPERKLRAWRKWLPLFVIAGIFFWLVFRWPGFWGFAVAGTLFHNQRQLWGFVRWYEKLSGHKRGATVWFFHAFIFLPVAIYLVRPLDPGHFYLVKGDIPHFGSLFLHQWLSWIWLGVFFIWVIYEIQLFLRHGPEWGRIYGLFSAALIYGLGFSLANTIMDIAFPLVLSHAVSYLAVMAQSSNRLAIRGLETRKSAWTALLLMAFLGGVLATFLLERFEFELWNQGERDLLLCFAVAMYFGPTLSHYIFDSWLWTGKHPDASLIFARHD
jgi:hypothetical protein